MTATAAVVADWSSRMDSVPADDSTEGTAT
jgi:hypothetical protein